MQRRLFVSALVLALAAGSAPVRADAVVPAPPELDVRPHVTAHTGPGVPASAQWEIHNRERAAVTVELTRAVLLLPRMRLPLRMGAVRVDGRPAARAITIPPGGTVIVEVALTDFSGPSEREREWEIELSMGVRGGGDHSGHAVGTTRVTRARTASR